MLVDVYKGWPMLPAIELSEDDERLVEFRVQERNTVDPAAINTVCQLLHGYVGALTMVHTRNDQIANLETANSTQTQIIWDLSNGLNEEKALRTKADEGYRNLAEIIRTAKNQIADAVQEHDGCNEGKREFLESTGLYESWEISDILDESIDLDVTVRVTVMATVGVQGLRSCIDSGEIDLDSDDVATAVSRTVHYDGVDDWEIVEIDEA